MCATAERFYAVSTVLANMVHLLQVHPSVRLLKHVVRCYLRLADHPRAREALKVRIHVIAVAKKIKRPFLSFNDESSFDIIVA